MMDIKPVLGNAKRGIVGKIVLILGVLVVLVVAYTELTSNCDSPFRNELSGCFEPYEDTLMKGELRILIVSGAESSIPKEAWFRKDAYIDQRSVVGDLSIKPEQVGFYCGSPDLCEGHDARIEVNTQDITVNQRTQAFVAVCGSKRAEKPTYCIGVGQDATDALNICQEKCGIKTA